MTTVFDDFEYFPAAGVRPAAGASSSVLGEDGFVDVLTRTEVGVIGGHLVYGLSAMNARDRAEGIRLIDEFLGRRAPDAGEALAFFDQAEAEAELERMSVFDPSQLG